MKVQLSSVAYKQILKLLTKFKVEYISKSFWNASYFNILIFWNYSNLLDGFLITKRVHEKQSPLTLLFRIDTLKNYLRASSSSWCLRWVGVRLIIMMGAMSLQFGAVLVTCFYGKTNVVNEYNQSVNKFFQHSGLHSKD